MKTDLQRTAGLWRISESSPLAVFASTGRLVPGVDREIRESLIVVERGGLDHADYDSVEEYENLKSLGEFVQFELAAAKARQLGRDHGAAAAHRWQARMTTHLGESPVAASVAIFMRAVEEHDPVALDALPTPPSDVTPSSLIQACDWPEPEPDDQEAHGRWRQGRERLWDAYEVEFYDNVQSATSEWARSPLAVEATTRPAPSVEEPNGPRHADPQVAADVLRQLAAPRRKFGMPRGASTLDEEVAHQAALLSHEGAVMSVVADALDGSSSWFEVVGSYAPSSRWADFEEHNPLWRFPWHEEVPVDAQALGPVETLERLVDARNDDAEVLRRLAASRPDRAEEWHRDRELIVRETATMSAIADALDGRIEWSDLVDAFAPSPDWPEVSGAEMAVGLPRDSEPPTPAQSLPTLRVEIVDMEALRTITPESLRAHLAQHGWRADAPFGAHSEYWVLDGSEEPSSVLVPSEPTFRDYPMLVSDILRTLSRVQNRSELDVFRDLNSVALEERLPRPAARSIGESGTRTGPDASPSPFIRPARESTIEVPDGWVAESIGVWDGAESEVVYNPRRFEIGGVHGTGEGVPVAGTRELLEPGGSRAVWLIDHVAAARAALERFDSGARGLETAGPELFPEPPTPELGL